MATQHTEIPGMYSGKITPVLLKLSMPIFAGMIFQLLYNITDTLWISMIDKSDPSYVGGTGIVFPVIFLAMALGNGIMVGMSSLVARSIGQGNHKALEKAAESGLVIAAGLSAFFVAGGFIFARPIISLLQATGDYYTHALEYFLYIIPCAAVMFATYVFAGILQGEGMMRPVMISMVLGTVSNIILDPVFIFILKMDVRGAAIATTIGQSISLVYVASVFLRNKSSIRVRWKMANFDTKVAGEIMRIGLPQSLAQIIMSMSFLAFNSIVISLDPIAITAFTLCGRFEQVVLIPIFAISAGMITMVGQNYGRGNMARVRKIWFAGIGVSAVAAFFFATVMFVAAPVIFPVFSDIPAVIDYAVRQIRIMEYSLVIATIGILARAVFQGVGKAMPGVFITILRLIGFAVPAVYFFTYTLGLGIPGVWYGLIAANCLSAVISFLWVRRTLNTVAVPALTAA